MRTAQERRQDYEGSASYLPLVKWPGGPWTDREIDVLRKACAVRFDEDVRTETLFAIASAAIRIFHHREKGGE